MTLYRNATWTARNYDCTNVVYQEVPKGDVPRRFNGSPAPEGEWVKTDKPVPAAMMDIGGFAGYRFHGFL